MRGAAYLLSLFICSSPVAAMEVDPYLAWMHEINDSTEVINRFINQTARETVEEVNGKPDKYDSCEAVTVRIFRRNHTSIFTSKRLLRHIHSNPDIDKLGRAHFEEVHGSMYRYVPQLYVSSLSDTINVNGIYIGDDKIAHFFGFGRRYYKRYLTALGKGKDTETALLEAIRYGVRNENGLMGKLIDGIFSHADLEANFQGMQMARSFCEGENPNLVGSAGAWVWDHDTDFSEFVIPTIDEGFNNSHYIKIYWPGVRRRLKRYCDIENLPFVMDRLADYKSRDQITLSRTFVAEYLGKKDFNRDLHSFDNSCTDPDRI
ncbi:MAG: hypothetical protein OES26_05345 [Gammaproteobacteria bacterium]|nr:hypothetical protein [Gammaproteobacteria bacterium]